MNEMGDKKNNNSLSPNKNLIKSETVLNETYLCAIYFILLRLFPKHFFFRF